MITVVYPVKLILDIDALMILVIFFCYLVSEVPSGGRAAVYRFKPLPTL